MNKLAPIPAQGPTEPGTYNVIGLAKTMRTDPSSNWIMSVVNDADQIAKGKSSQNYLTARDVGDYMTALAMAKRRASETMAQAYTRLCNDNETMKTLYAAHEMLKAKGLHGKPRNKVPLVEEDDEEESSADARDS